MTVTISQADIDAGKNFSLYSLESQTSANPMATVLGIDKDYLLQTDVLVDALPDLVGLKHIYVSSNALSNNVSLIENNKKRINIFCDIPITVDFGKFQIEDNDANTLDYTDFHSRKNISTIDIKLMNELNETLDLNGLDWVLVFRVYF